MIKDRIRRFDEAEIARCLNRVAVLRFDIAAMSGKEAIELVRKRLQE